VVFVADAARAASGSFSEPFLTHEFLCSTTACRGLYTKSSENASKTGHVFRPLGSRLCAGRWSFFRADSIFPGSGTFPLVGGGSEIGVGGGLPAGRTRTRPLQGKKVPYRSTTTTGMLRRWRGNPFVIQGYYHRIITYKAGDKMTVTRDGEAGGFVELRSRIIISVDATAG